MIGETRTAQGNQNSENLNIPRSHGLSVSLNQQLSYHIYIHTHVIISLAIFSDSSSKCELYLLTDYLLVRRKAHYLVEKGKKQQQKQNKKIR